MRVAGYLQGRGGGDRYVYQQQDIFKTYGLVGVVDKGMFMIITHNYMPFVVYSYLYMFGVCVVVCFFCGKHETQVKLMKCVRDHCCAKFCLLPEDRRKNWCCSEYSEEGSDGVVNSPLCHFCGDMAYQDIQRYKDKEIRRQQLQAERVVSVKANCPNNSLKWDKCLQCGTVVCVHEAQCCSVYVSDFGPVCKECYGTFMIIHSHHQTVLYLSLSLILHKIYTVYYSDIVLICVV